MSSTDSHNQYDPHGEAVLSDPDAAAIERGHEADRYDPYSVWSVPVIVALFFVLAFVTTTILFYYLAPSKPDPAAHPLAVERNQAPLQERLGRIGRGREIDQPRLEPLRIRTGDARAITRPEAPEGNSPELHPEDLRPSPTKTPELYRREWIAEGKLARLPVDETMELLIKKGQFAVSKNRQPPRRSTEMPTAANAGRPARPATGEVIAPPTPQPPSAPQPREK